MCCRNCSLYSYITGSHINNLDLLSSNIPGYENNRRNSQLISLQVSSKAEHSIEADPQSDFLCHPTSVGVAAGRAVHSVPSSPQIYSRVTDPPHCSPDGSDVLFSAQGRIPLFCDILPALFTLVTVLSFLATEQRHLTQPVIANRCLMLTVSLQGRGDKYDSSFLRKMMRQTLMPSDAALSGSLLEKG